jgi:predicted NAD/FAD-dependent oxidoreductase
MKTFASSASSKQNEQSSSLPVVPHVAVIGGGIAGLSAASKLKKLKIPTTVFDMGTRVPGGRACSRILTEDSKELAFDHGAQFIAPQPGSEFDKEVKEWVKAGVAALWQGRFGSLDSKTFKFTPYSNEDSNRIIDHIGGTTTTDGFCGIASRTRTTTTTRTENSMDSVYVGVPHQGAIAQHLTATINSTIHRDSTSTPVDSTTTGTSDSKNTPARPPPGATIPSILQVHPNDSKIKIGHKVTGLFYNKTEKLWRVEGVPRSASAATPASFGKFNAVVIADALVVLPDSAGYAAGLVQEDQEEDKNEEVERIVAQIQTITHQPVFSLLVAFATDPDSKSNLKKKEGKERNDGIVSIDGILPFDGASLISRESSDIPSGFQWIARNSSKPGRGIVNQSSDNVDGGGSSDGSSTSGGSSLSTWVGITTPCRARELLQSWPLHTTKGTYNPQTHEYRDAVAKELLGEFLETLEKAAAARAQARSPTDGANENKENTIDLRSRVVYYHAQRWGRGFVENPLEVDYLGSESSLFAACGDFCGGSIGGRPPLEAAWLSGQRAADAVASWLGSDSTCKL